LKLPPAFFDRVQFRRIRRKCHKGEVALADGDATVTDTFPALEDIELRIADSLSVPSDNERQLIREIVAPGEGVSYNVQKQFTTPSG
jgi:hypothetical protein